VVSAPRVSVIVNCYNGERYLKEALDSIYQQSMTDFEVIFWDNVSTDGSAAIAQRPEYAPRLKYFRASENIPLGGARNLAVEKASGEFIAFLDTDDRWYPHTLSTMLAAANEGIDVVYAGVQNINADGAPLSVLSPPARSGSLLGALLTQFDIYVPALLVRRSALAKSGLVFDPAVTASEEYCLFVQLAAEVGMKSIPDVLADYRIHANALTGKSNDKWADERFYTLDQLLKRHPEVRETHRAELDEAMARGRYYRARQLMVRGDRAGARRELRAAWPAGAIYKALYALAWLPTTAWQAIHQWKTRRHIA
jgi:glycosyltransferase involved in cell wall biosynthesis